MRQPFVSDQRQGWHPTHLLLVLAVWLATVGNLPLWLAIWDLPEMKGWRPVGTVLGLSAFLAAALGWFLAWTVWPRWLKPAGVLWLLVATSSSFFMVRYGIVIDASMLANVAHTDVREVRDLLSPAMFAALLIGVGVPGWWWWHQPVRNVYTGPLLRRQLGVSVLAVLVAGVVFWAMFQDLASLMRNHKSLRYMINPFNSVYALVDMSIGKAARAQGPLQPIGQDARPAPAVPQIPPGAPMIVLVVGETARAANFGLGGYARDTTPRLAELQRSADLLYYPQVRSCGTNTQASVPCMFSHLGKKGYESSTERYENLLDVLYRAGWAVLWLDNQSGCKGLCDRVASAETRTLNVPEVCENGECYDEVMLHGLAERLAALPAERRAVGTLVVMHQMGSHGPAYYKRTPVALKHFQPECSSNALQDCTPESLVNTYDNTIRYTDHFLAQTVAWLQTQKRPTALWYVSDHGESLGENGLYLHGMPYSLAPEQQTHVPMVSWLSPPMQQRNGLRMDCLRGQATQPWTHDNLFHTMLGLARVSTQVYDAGKDVLAGCVGR